MQKITRIQPPTRGVPDGFNASANVIDAADYRTRREQSTLCASDDVGDDDGDVIRMALTRAAELRAEADHLEALAGCWRLASIGGRAALRNARIPFPGSAAADLESVPVQLALVSEA